MTISFKVRKDEPLEDGSYRAVLKSMEKKETTFGTRILWLFEALDHNVEVAGFTSLSDSSRANAFLWATALNEEVGSQKTWSPADVIGRECILEVTTIEDSKGRKKNKILRVRPAALSS